MKPQIFIALLSLALLLISNPGNAQQVFATSGGTGQNASGTITYTLGELVIDTYSGNDIQLTQGFHQPKLVITEVNQLPDLTYTISVFPNPATSYVNVLLEKDYPVNLEYLLIDLNGKEISGGKLKDNQTEVSFETLPRGTFFLKIIQERKEVKTLKVVKQ